MAYWQSQFAISTAQARAGDDEAAGRLSSLSQALLRAAEDEAASMFDLQRIRAQVAASLSETAAVAEAIAGGDIQIAQPSATSVVITAPPAPADTGPQVVVHVDPNAAAEQSALRQLVERQGAAMIDLLDRMESMQARWTAVGLPVVEVAQP